LAAVAAAFQVDVDLNEYNSTELAFAASHFQSANNSWSITVNSPGTSDGEWAAALGAIGARAFSEDNPGGSAECARVRRLAPSKFVASFQYHETGGVPATMLNASAIDAASAACGGCGIIVLTRAFWPGSPWRTNVEAVLGHPKLYGVAMEFNPSDAGKRYEGEFVNEVLAHGKTPFFLLPFANSAPGGAPAEKTIETAIDTFSAMGAKMADPRVHVVLARYSTPPFPVQGSTNSIEAAFAKAKQMAGQAR
jgi:hypothetical protein